MPMSYYPESSHDTFTLTMATPVVVDETGGTKDYNELENKPVLNGIALQGEVSLEDIGVQPAGSYPSKPLTPEDIDEIIDSLE